MSSKIFGIRAGELVPTHEFSFERTSEGKFRASHSFRCLYTDYISAPIQNKLAQGTRITDLDPNLPINLNFLGLETFTTEHQKGGITKIRCTFTGYSSAEYPPNSDAGEDIDGDGVLESYTYSLNGVYQQMSILRHPNYLAQVTQATDRAAIAGLWSDKAYLEKDAGTYYLLSTEDKKDFGAGAITNTNVQAWIDLIVEKKIKYYDAPSFEWTRNGTSKDGLTDAQVDAYGRAYNFTPPGNPPLPGWANDGWWFFSGVSQEKTNDSATHSITFTLRQDEKESLIYDY